MYGATLGPSIATIAIAAMMEPPQQKRALPHCRFAEPDAWVQRGITDIGDQVGNSVDCGDHQHAGLKQWQIVVLDRIDQHPSQAGIGEDRLDHDDSADQDTGIDHQHCDRR